MIDKNKLITELDKLDCISNINYYTNNCNSYNDIISTINEVFEDEELSAEEMFEELGYEQTSYLGMLMYKNFKTGRTILFMENDAKGHEFKGVSISSTDKGFAMNIELLTAIDKQLKELGWI